MRPMSGMRKPKNIRFGTDFAGVVEAVGKDVTNFKPGDEVFGAKNGAVADYVCVKAERAIVSKPSNVTFEQAGSVAVAALTALQGLRDKGHIQSGQKVLINGASGGVGTFAVQIAKVFGADVTAVCSTRNVDLVKSIGADHVIDYTKEDFTKTDQHYDMIYDLGWQPFFLRAPTDFETQRHLCPRWNWRCRSTPGNVGAYRREFRDAFLSNFSNQKSSSLLHRKLTKDDLNVLRDLMQSGKVAPVIDRTYKMSETRPRSAIWKKVTPAAKS